MDTNKTKIPTPQIFCTHGGLFIEPIRHLGLKSYWIAITNAREEVIFPGQHITALEDYDGEKIEIRLASLRIKENPGKGPQKMLAGEYIATVIAENGSWALESDIATVRFNLSAKNIEAIKAEMRGEKPPLEAFAEEAQPAESATEAVPQAAPASIAEAPAPQKAPAEAPPELATLMSRIETLILLFKNVNDQSEQMKQTQDLADMLSKKSAILEELTPLIREACALTVESAELADMSARITSAHVERLVGLGKGIRKDAAEGNDVLVRRIGAMFARIVNVQRTNSAAQETAVENAVGNMVKENAEALEKFAEKISKMISGYQSELGKRAAPADGGGADRTDQSLLIEALARSTEAQQASNELMAAVKTALSEPVTASLPQELLEELRQMRKEVTEAIKDNKSHAALKELKDQVESLVSALQQQSSSQAGNGHSNEEAELYRALLLETNGILAEAISALDKKQAPAPPKVTLRVYFLRLFGRFKTAREMRKVGSELREVKAQVASNEGHIDALGQRVSELGDLQEQGNKMLTGMGTQLEELARVIKTAPAPAAKAPPRRNWSHWLFLAFRLWLRLKKTEAKAATPAEPAPVTQPAPPPVAQQAPAANQTAGQGSSGTWWMSPRWAVIVIAVALVALFGNRSSKPSHSKESYQPTGYVAPTQLPPEVAALKAPNSDMVYPRIGSSDPQ